MQRKLISWVVLFLVIILAAFPFAPAAHAQESRPQNAGINPSEGSIQTSAPIDFGYTASFHVWHDWVDVKTSGTSLGMTGTSDQKTITLPFDFPFYGLFYDQMTVTLDGVVAFNTPYKFNQSWSLLSDAPNNYISLYTGDLEMDIDGGVYWIQGGTAPNRYIVIEWYNVVPEHNLSKLMTFEVVLYENGNILFDYESLPEWWSIRFGMENLTGDQYWFDDGVSSGDTILIEYPTSTAARMLVDTRQSSLFMYAGTQQTYWMDIYNNGHLPGGNDTYELDIQNVDSVPASYDLLVNGVPTLLTDTNGNGTVDTGPISEGEKVQLRVQLEAPTTVTPGDYGDFQFAVSSAADPTVMINHTLKLSIPGRFVEAYHSQDDDRIHVNFYSPMGMVESSFPVGEINGEYPGPSMVQAPNGDVLIAWTEVRSLIPDNTQVQELYYAILSSDGTIKHAPTQLTNWSGATMYSMDELPAVAAAADGTFGISWLKFQINETDITKLNNIFISIIGTDGLPVDNPVNMTNQTTWISMYLPFDTGFLLSRPQLAAAGNRYGLTWEASNTSQEGAFYAVMDSQQGVVKTATDGAQIPAGSGMTIETPAITAFQQDTQEFFMITYRKSDATIMGFSIDLTGNATSPRLLVNDTTSFDSRYFKPVQLPNRNFLLIGPQMTILLDSGYQEICRTDALEVGNNIYPDKFPSIAVHEDNTVTILFFGSYIRTARISGTDCAVLTHVSKIHEPETPTQSRPIYSPQGYGLSHALDASVPSGVDLRVSTGARKESERNVVIRLENAGLAVSPTTTLSITLDPHLTLADSSVPPDVTNGQTYTWNLGTLSYQETSQISITLGYGSSTAKGVLYPVQISAATGGTETNPLDNTQTVYISSPYLTNIPLIYR